MTYCMKTRSIVIKDMNQTMALISVGSENGVLEYKSLDLILIQRP